MGENALKIRSLYLRVCRDSRYTISSGNAAILVAQMLGISPLEVWVAMPSLSVMDEIAAGAHPAAQKALEAPDA